MSTDETLSSILQSVHRKDYEPPPVISRLGWRYHHIGIPTNTPRPSEKHLEAFALHVSGFSTSAFEALINGSVWCAFVAFASELDAPAI
jgi:hypothetical protein